jgi:hypothetical protein
MNACQCRLLVVGSATDLNVFSEREEWPAAFTEIELLELSSTRRSWQFTTPNPPLTFLRLLAARWSRLTFLVDYDTGRTKGLVWLRGAKQEHHQIVYRGGGS